MALAMERASGNCIQCREALDAVGVAEAKRGQT